MKIGDSVIVRNIPDNIPWKEIEGRQGVILAKDILGNLHVFISGYPHPFILRPRAVEKIETS